MKETEEKGCERTEVSRKEWINLTEDNYEDIRAKF